MYSVTCHTTASCVTAIDWGVFANRVLWRMCGPKRTGGAGRWIKMCREEFSNLVLARQTCYYIAYLQENLEQVRHQNGIFADWSEVLESRLWPAVSAITLVVVCIIIFVAIIIFIKFNSTSHNLVLGSMTTPFYYLRWVGKSDWWRTCFEYPCEEYCPPLEMSTAVRVYRSFPN
jgi:hypothetical protein